MHNYLAIISGMALFFTATGGAAAEQGTSNDRFTSSFRVLTFAEAQYPAHSTQNPENAFLQLYRYSTEVDVRPDLFYDAEYVSGVFKPRFTSAYRWWEDGIMQGERDSLTRVFVNEWRIQGKPHDRLFLSFGKEKLLWGPSFLASPSNILFKDTEKINPMKEVEGTYLARVMYLPTSAFTANAIAETQQDDAMPQANDNPIRAVKADWVGASASVSVIGYFKQDDRFRLGSYGQVTASDAVLLYYDGIISRGTDALFPVQDPASPLGGGFEKIHADSGRIFPTVTIGGSYTFLSGATFSIEYLYNGQGYGDADAEAYYRLRRTAAGHFGDGGAISGLSQMTLAEALAAGNPFLRRYYLMAQINSGEIRNSLTVIVRYIRGLDERAGQASSIVEWTLSDRVQLFNLITAALPAGGETEFNAILDTSVQLGLESHW